MSMLRLHGYWRSSATYRVRIALNLKGIAYEEVGHDLRAGAQRADDYLAIAPHGLVPAIDFEGRQLIESPALIEWLDARFPEPPLLPADPDEAVIVRGMAALIACDIHPLNNLRVLDYLRMELGATASHVRRWISHWVTAGFVALEQLVARYGGAFAFGDAPGLADCYLVPQLYNAERYGVDLAAFPHLVRIGASARSLPAFADADPARQPGATE